MKINEFLKENSDQGIGARELAEVLFNHLIHRYPDVVKRFGHEVVGDAVIDAANFHAGATELGTSDISIMLREIIRQLERRQDLDEGGGGGGKSPIEDLANAIIKNIKGLKELGESRNLKKKSIDEAKFVDVTTWSPKQVQRLGHQDEPTPRDDQPYEVDRVYFQVPFDRRETAKAFGCRWDSDKKLWYKPKYNTSGGNFDWQIKQLTKEFGQPLELDEGLTRRSEPGDYPTPLDPMNEDLRKWFKEKWVRFGPDGKIRGTCASGKESEGKPKCLPQKKAHALGKKGRASAAQRKRRQDPNPERSGKAINVATKKKKADESVHQGQLDELKCWPGYHRVKGTKKGFPGSCAKNESVSEAADKCPPATQDIKLNLENRQKAIDEYGYGPLNPALPNTKFWLKKVDEWNLDSVDEAKQSLCGNCAAFDQRKKTLDCIAQGIDQDDPQDAAATIDAGDLGYCKFLKFKCASKRTCDAWVTGGPLTDKKEVDEQAGKTWVVYREETTVGPDQKNKYETEAVREFTNSQSADKFAERLNAAATKDEDYSVSYFVKSKKSDVTEGQCPHCGGEMVAESELNEKKDACYYKVKSRYKVWPSAYASGALVKCRRAGAKNWGKKKTNENDVYAVDNEMKDKHIKQEMIGEKWSEKYKRSIDCSHPRGFSQRAHCQGRKKKK